jgi:hypothetical protein
MHKVNGKHVYCTCMKSPEEIGEPSNLLPDPREAEVTIRLRIIVEVDRG